jgi:hypothetical protein
MKKRRKDLWCSLPMLEIEKIHQMVFTTHTSTLTFLNHNVHTLENLVKSSEIQVLEMKHLNVVEVQAKDGFMNNYILNLCLIT